MNATCDSCNQITKIEFKQVQHPKGIQETYFKCDQCHKRHTCFVTDSTVRRWQGKEDVNRPLEEHERLPKGANIQDEINERMSRLKYELESM